MSPPVTTQTPSDMSSTAQSTPVDKNNNPVVDLEEVGIPGLIRYLSVDGTWFSAIDTVMAVNAQDNNHAAKTIQRISQKTLNDLKIHTVMHKFKGRGQKPTMIMTVKGIYKLIMIIPGNAATSLRLKIIDVLVEKLLDLKETRFLEDTLHKTLQEHHAEEAKNPGMEQGFIYATESAAFPGLLKIGRTTDIAKRIQNLFTATAPSPHKVVALTPTLNAVRDELKAHEFFADKRVAGEFFKTTASEVSAFFHAEIMPTYNDEIASMDAIID